MPLICMGKDIETQRRETFSPVALVNIPLLLIASTPPPTYPILFITVAP